PVPDAPTKSANSNNKPSSRPAVKTLHLLCDANTGKLSSKVMEEAGVKQVTFSHMSDTRRVTCSIFESNSAFKLFFATCKMLVAFCGVVTFQIFTGRLSLGKGVPRPSKKVSFGEETTFLQKKLALIHPSTYRHGSKLLEAQ
ncbi:hypothetical protein M1146_04795, partial [Patescibacteria group bacterium]|nr:hypothetical protein [Patescibacteria group bacterium]